MLHKYWKILKYISLFCLANNELIRIKLYKYIYLFYGTIFQQCYYNEYLAFIFKTSLSKRSITGQICQVKLDGFDSPGKIGRIRNIGIINNHIILMKGNNPLQVILVIN